MLKYKGVDGMSMTQKVDGIAREFLGVASDADLVADSGPSAERYSPPSSSKLTPLWSKMDLSRIDGFPTWEEQVFGLLESNLDDLQALFAYYAGDEGLMQQTELVDLVADCALATPQFGLPKIIKLFDEVNKQTGATDSDLELHEFLQLVVQLAHASVGGGIGGGADAGAALSYMLQNNLAISARKETVVPILAALKEDANATGALASANDAVQAKFAAAAGGKAVDSASFVKQLAAAKVMRGCIVGDVRCDLTWLDASAAFASVAGGSPVSAADYGLALAVCGAIKYGKVDALSPAKRVAGIVANLQGAMDEHAVVAAK